MATIRHSSLFSIVIAALSLLLLAPLTSEFQALGLLVLAIFCWATSWLKPIHAGVMVPIVGLMLGAVSMEEIATKAFNPVVSVFVFGFVFAHLFRRAGLGNWVQGTVLRLSGGSQPLALMGFALLAFVTSMVVTNVATVALMFPIALSLAPYTPGERGTPLQKYIGVVIVLCATMGGISSIIGSTTSLIVSGLTDIELSEWTLLMLPITLSITALGAIMAAWVFRPEFGVLEQPLPKAPSLNPRQKRICGAIALVLLSWFGCYRYGGETGRVVATLIPWLSIPLLARIAKDRVSSLLAGIKWSVVCIFVSALILSTILRTHGLADYLIVEMSDFIDALPREILILGMLLTIMLFTEFVSNSGTVAIWGPFVLFLSAPLQLDLAQVAIILAVGGSSSFILPSSTPGNAILYGAGVVTTKEMVPLGYRLKAITLLVCVVGLLYW